VHGHMHVHVCFLCPHLPEIQITLIVETIQKMFSKYLAKQNRLASKVPVFQTQISSMCTACRIVGP
jgi:hypothetical protein